MKSIILNLCGVAAATTSFSVFDQSTAGALDPAESVRDHQEVAEWALDNELTTRLVKLINTADAEGLPAARYGLRIGDRHQSRWTEQERQQVLYAFVDFALDVRDGAVNPRLNFIDSTVSPRDDDRRELLKRLELGEKPGVILSEMYSATPQQQPLRRALERYRAYAESGGWSEIALSSDVVEAGDTGHDVQLIADRLAVEGFLRDNLRFNENDEPVFDRVLEASVEAFQRSRGIADDGVVGPETISRMNIAAQTLVDALKANIERARWLPQDFPERFIVVNIASFELKMFEFGKVHDAMAVIVGTEQDETPVFAAELDYLVVNPYWNIPKSIVVDEIAPKQAGNASYLQSKNMEVLADWTADARVLDPSTIDWRQLSSPIPFRVRQKPGTTNALGQIKFMFPNKYSVYLHDTPSDSLFDRGDRALSHGCVRVERPFELAEWVVGDDQVRIDSETISTFDPATRIEVDELVGVYIVYATVEVGDDGTVFFFDDIYERDDSLLAALNNPA